MEGAGGVIVNEMVKKGLADKVRSGKRLEGGKGPCLADI